MKKLALALMAISASIFGISAVANAYPPAAGVSKVSTTSPAPGAAFSVEVGCTPPGNVDFEFNGTTQSVACAASVGGAVALLATPAAGSAAVTFTAPTTPGTYTGTYTGAATGSFVITVAAPATPADPAGGLPATGSNGTSTMTIIAFGLFAAGAGLFGVSQVRRRTAVTA